MRKPLFPKTFFHFVIAFMLILSVGFTVIAVTARNSAETTPAAAALSK